MGSTVGLRAAKLDFFVVARVLITEDVVVAVDSDLLVHPQMHAANSASAIKRLILMGDSPRGIEVDERSMLFSRELLLQANLQQLIRIDVHRGDHVFGERKFIERFAHQTAQAHDGVAANQDVETELALQFFQRGGRRVADDKLSAEFSLRRRTNVSAESLDRPSCRFQLQQRGERLFQPRQNRAVEADPEMFKEAEQEEESLGPGL